MSTFIGRMEEKKIIKPVLDTHCYQCSSITKWDLYRETNWMSVLGIKFIPIGHKYYLSCQNCHDEFKLKSEFVTFLKSSSDNNESTEKIRRELINELEDNQLSSKTEKQLAYIQSLRTIKK
ncbi:MAG: zinc-ribbon domain-containing protein [Gammaproteobacteria bacterium]|nr:zinc-ribbon domain-containing protein [Gammaproteobacteria bacterium]